MDRLMIWFQRAKEIEGGNDEWIAFDVSNRMHGEWDDECRCCGPQDIRMNVKGMMD
jgi:hypothetical protein